MRYLTNFIKAVINITITFGTILACVNVFFYKWIIGEEVVPFYMMILRIIISVFIVSIIDEVARIILSRTYNSNIFDEEKLAKCIADEFEKRQLSTEDTNNTQ